MRILIVEDDKALVRGLSASLKAMGYAVDHESDGAEAASIAVSEPYSLIVLDLGLPNRSGFEVLRQVRANGSKVPIMILTARDATADRVKGLDLGADDYVRKPFDLSEFEARVRALVRRGQGRSSPLLTCGSIVIDTVMGNATLDGKLLDLRRRELAVLRILMLHHGKLVPKDRLIAEVFGFDEPVGPNVLELYIGRLRQKLGPGGPKILTKRGLGYLLEVN
jgi:two-component system response regulator TctD